METILITKIVIALIIAHALNVGSAIIAGIDQLIVTVIRVIFVLTAILREITGANVKL
jgi:hypothetical protein